MSPEGTAFRFKNKLLSLDATLIDLCATVFDWAQHRRTKGAVKLHLLLETIKACCPATPSSPKAGCMKAALPALCA